MLNTKKILSSFKKSVAGIVTNLPVIIGVILLLGLFKSFINIKKVALYFSGDLLKDTFIGSFLGSIFAGNPSNSYIIGEELLKNDISLFAITAFIMAWVTVGIVQLPAESSFFGIKFALIRNLFAFISSIIISILIVLTIGYIS
ncbi:MAG: hypothetical protein FXF47_07135 [Candidatus Mcinerneyibacterium aminivorans]|uniref:Permease n=1 Tax=Candidatus Mcinerneyibacterium aminivorans TaxID=2703815 RepID=A0A5D0MGW4_9BACT|nr:MAG: hypothetical protein FXF47_07135 [Candidatus Mcinerneyibacterium aminivorans]